MDRSPFDTASMGHDGSFDHRPQNEEGLKMGITIVEIDLAKNVFRLHGCDEQGRAVLRKQLTRGQLLAFMAQVPACTGRWKPVRARTIGGASWSSWVIE